MLEKLEENNVKVIFVPPNCTDLLQPLDVSINKPLKAEIKKQFITWYSGEVQSQLNNGTNTYSGSKHSYANEQDETTCCSMAGWCFRLPSIE